MRLLLHGWRGIAIRLMRGIPESHIKAYLSYEPKSQTKRMFASRRLRLQNRQFGRHGFMGRIASLKTKWQFQESLLV